MKTKRWMKWVLDESAKTEHKLPFGRGVTASSMADNQHCADPWQLAQSA